LFRNVSLCGAFIKTSVIFSEKLRLFERLRGFLNTFLVELRLFKVMPLGGLAIVAMRLWSQGPLQSLLQNVKKRAILEEFWGPLGIFVWNFAEVF
jgi:hypothetical protein